LRNAVKLAAGFVVPVVVPVVVVLVVVLEVAGAEDAELDPHAETRRAQARPATATSDALAVTRKMREAPGEPAAQVARRLVRWCLRCVMQAPCRRNVRGT